MKTKGTRAWGVVDERGEIVYVVLSEDLAKQAYSPSWGEKIIPVLITPLPSKGRKKKVGK